MPQLTVRGVEPRALRTVAAAMLEELAAICGCGTDNFTIDCLQLENIAGGVGADAFPFVEVGWFDRGPEVRDRFAAAVHRHLTACGVAESEVAFRAFSPSAYYINGAACE